MNDEQTQVTQNADGCESPEAAEARRIEALMQRLDTAYKYVTQASLAATFDEPHPHKVYDAAQRAALDAYKAISDANVPSARVRGISLAMLVEHATLPGQQKFEYVNISAGEASELMLMQMLQRAEGEVAANKRQIAKLPPHHVEQAVQLVEQMAEVTKGLADGSRVHMCPKHREEAEALLRSFLTR